MFFKTCISFNVKQSQMLRVSRDDFFSNLTPRGQKGCYSMWIFERIKICKQVKSYKTVILLVNFFSRIHHEDILFTDWQTPKKPGCFQLSGIEEVKTRIGDYLLKYKIFGKHEQAELYNCFNTMW